MIQRQKRWKMFGALGTGHAPTRWPCRLLKRRSRTIRFCQNGPDTNSDVPRTRRGRPSRLGSRHSKILVSACLILQSDKNSSRISGHRHEELLDSEWGQCFSNLHLMSKDRPGVPVDDLVQQEQHVETRCMSRSPTQVICHSVELLVSRHRPDIDLP
jgi:hypothetical protein